MPNEEAILAFCSEQLTRAEIAKQFGLMSWTIWTQIHTLHPLVERGMLEKEYPDR